jgi:hypothetical protein
LFDIFTLGLQNTLTYIYFIRLNNKNIKPKTMKKYIKIDYVLNFSSICDTKEEVIEGCGYEVDEITFEELLEKVKGTYEIIEIEGDVNPKWLTDEE